MVHPMKTLQDRVFDILPRQLKPSVSLLGHEMVSAFEKRPSGQYLGVRSPALVDVKRVWLRDVGSTVKVASTDTEKIPGLEDSPTSLQSTAPSSDIEIESSSSGFSLRDPITRNFWKIPVRGDVCKHGSCFDFAT
jgi:hypothetical protein